MKKEDSAQKDNLESAISVETDILSILPIHFQGSVSQRGYIFIPNWIGIIPDSEYIFEIRHKKTKQRYTLKQVIKKRADKKGNYISIGGKTRTPFKYGDDLQIIIIERVKEAPLVSTMDKTTIQFYPYGHFRILMLYYLDNSLVLKTYETNDTFSNQYPEFLEEDYMIDTYNLLKNYKKASQNIPNYFLDVKQYTNFNLVRYFGTKREIGKATVLEKGIPLESLKQKYANIVPFALIIVTQQYYINYFTHSTIQAHINEFLKDYEGLTQYDNQHIQALSKEIFQKVKNLEEREFTQKERENSLFNILFQAKIPLEYQQISRSLIEWFSSGKEQLSETKLVEITYKTAQNSLIEQKTVVKNALLWLLNEKVISISREHNEIVIAVI